MHKIYNRHMIAKVAGCSLSTVAKVVMAMEFLASKANLDCGEVIPCGLASSIPPTSNAAVIVEQNYLAVKNSLNTLMTEDSSDKIKPIRDTRSLMYSSHDDAAIEQEMQLTKRERKRA